VFGQPLPNDLFEGVECFDGADFKNEQDVTLTLITDGRVELRVEGGFILREVVKINNSAVNVTELDITTAAVDEAPDNRMKDFGSLRNWITGKSKRTLWPFNFTPCWLLSTSITGAGAAAVFVMVGFFNVDFVLGLV
jgi:hypothetical protein